MLTGLSWFGGDAGAACSLAFAGSGMNARGWLRLRPWCRTGPYRRGALELASEYPGVVSGQKLRRNLLFSVALCLVTRPRGSCRIGPYRTRLVVSSPIGSSNRVVLGGISCRRGSQSLRSRFGRPFADSLPKGSSDAAALCCVGCGNCSQSLDTGSCGPFAAWSWLLPPSLLAGSCGGLLACSAGAAPAGVLLEVTVAWGSQAARGV